ncbi:MAG: DUF6624 domain-containing protein [Bacteroidia bacterium]
MKRSVLFTSALLLLCAVCAAQVPARYYEYVEQAKNSFKAKQFRNSGLQYASAFKANGGKAFMEDRYDAARAWSRTGNKDSAFAQLLKVAFLYDFTEYSQLTSEKDFEPLHADERWKTVTDVVKSNIGKADARMNKGVVTLLDSVYRNHHSFRLEEVSVKNQYGEGSPQLEEIRKTIRQKDSLNILIIRGVLDKYGWLGRNVAGFIGNYTIALVMEHADLKTQEEYLPLIRKAFKDGKLEPFDYAMLEDRVALREGKKQTYGSVVVNIGGKNYVAPIEDPANLDKKRKEVGLNRMNDYLSDWNIKWDLSRYQKDLLFLEKEKISY